MALGNTNPIKYSDLISPDDSISNLIKQLDEFSEQHHIKFTVMLSCDRDVAEEHLSKYL